METYKLTKYYKQAVIVYAALAIIIAGVTALLHFVPSIDDITAFARVVLLLVIITVMFRKTVGFEQNKYKSIPLLLLPVGLFSFTNSALYSLADLFSGFGDHLVNASVQYAITSVITLIICLLGYTKLVNRYAALYEEKSSLVFPREFRLKSKWWFLLVGDLVGGFVISIINTVSNFAGAFLTPITNAIGIVLHLLIIYAFFNVALKSIDKNTRMLFVPNIFLIIIPTLFNYVIVFITALTPLKTSQEAASSILQNPTDTAVLLKALTALAPSLIFNAAFSVLALVLCLYLCAKNFEAYELK
ncbi:MAG: hypothetical protein IJR60_06650 [Eubacterium sp.]|nr:hypothetical protein [Eubacterium sp.]